MTYQILYRYCKFCDDPMNHCGDRGNGKQRDFCDTQCQRKMYTMKKRIENYMKQMNLRNNKFEPEGEFTENNFKFVQLAIDYLQSNLPASRIAVHLNAALEGKNSSPFEDMFRIVAENNGKEKCLI